jgi:hypothetical protein
MFLVIFRQLLGNKMHCVRNVKSVDHVWGFVTNVMNIWIPSQVKSFLKAECVLLSQEPLFSLKDET